MERGFRTLAKATFQGIFRGPLKLSGNLSCLMSALLTSLAQSTLGALGFLGLQLTCEPPSSAFVFHLVFSETAVSLPSQSEATKAQATMGQALCFLPASLSRQELPRYLNVAGKAPCGCV